MTVSLLSVEISRRAEQRVKVLKAKALEMKARRASLSEEKKADIHAARAEAA